jgi:hypothetical protein
LKKNEEGVFVLKRKVVDCIALQNARKASHKPRPTGIFTEFFETFELVCKTFKGVRDAGHPLDSGIIQGMAYRVVALCKLHNIPPELVVNSDQTAIYMWPAAEQTYETKGVKAVQSLGKDEKRQITGMVSSASSGSMLPLQLIFQGKTTAMVPNHVEAREAVKKGWDLTNSENHWSNQTTMKRFVEKVLDPWRVKKCRELGLDSSKQKMVWLIDCWKVHTSEEFRNRLKENHPFVHYLYVAANCTSKL